MHPPWLRCSSLEYSQVHYARRALPGGRLDAQKRALILARTLSPGAGSSTFWCRETIFHADWGSTGRELTLWEGSPLLPYTHRPPPSPRWRLRYCRRIAPERRARTARLWAWRRSSSRDCRASAAPWRRPVPSVCCSWTPRPWWRSSPASASVPFGTRSGTCSASCRRSPGSTSRIRTESRP